MQYNTTLFDFFLLLPKFRSAQRTIRRNIDGAEQLWVKDLFKVTAQWLPRSRIEPALSVLQTVRSNHLEMSVKIK